MKRINLKLIEEDRRRMLYKIEDSIYSIDNKDFKVDISTSNLSSYLNTKGISLIELLSTSIDNRCVNCQLDVVHNRFTRKVFIKYKFCKSCDNAKIINKYNIVKCASCKSDVLYKDVTFSTCGKEGCIKSHRLYVNSIIKDTHWMNRIDKGDILSRRSDTRIFNDKKYNRKYKAWNKGKTGIYSKETIEKIRNATINQMKNGRIKKTRQEEVFENLLIDNNIKYIYSFIYDRRQYDFLLVDYDIVVELQGDYWHANPRFWDVNGDDLSKKRLYETQIMKIKDDKIKKSLIDNSKYDIIIFWEHDIHNNITNVRDELIKKIKNKK